MSVSRWSRVVLTWAFLVLALFIVTSRSTVSAADLPTAGSGQPAIIRWALAAVGQQQGECFPWMRRVVQAATGRMVGHDYRLAYLQAGAIDVPSQTARSGDVIQIAKDSDTSPTADYPGLHTAFILENQGGGKFKVVDSNSNFDGVVRVRDGYDPAAAAARYPGLSVRIYRFPEAAPGATAPDPPVSAANTPGNIPIGSAAEIAADGDCLRVRTIAGLSGGIVGCLPTGARVTVTQPGPDVDGYHWVTISNGSISGWASERYLRAIASTVITTPTAPVVPVAPPPPPKPSIISGSVPQRGFGLIVFSGGTDAELLSASGCPIETASFWSYENGRFVLLLPGVPVPIVNAEWRAKFPNGVPSGTPLIGRCRPFEAPSAPAPSGAPAPSPVPVATTPVSPTLTVPPPPTGAPSTAPPSTHTVVEGDSLSSIAERFHGPDVSIGAFLDALYEANGLTQDSLLAIGQVLRIPR